MKVLLITIFVVSFTKDVLGQFNAPKSIEKGFAPVRSYFEKDSSPSPSYENPNYGHPNSNFSPNQYVFMPQAQALTADPPQYNTQQVPEAISNYLATISQKYGGQQQNVDNRQQAGPQVFVPPQMARQSPFQAPDQYQFVPPDPQSFQQPTQHQQPPVQFNQPEFANIQPAIPQYATQQGQYPNQQDQYQNIQAQYQSNQVQYQSAQPQYSSQQTQYPNHQPQYTQEQPQYQEQTQYQEQPNPVQVSYQSPENLGQLPPITKNPNDIVDGYPNGGQGQSRPPPTKYVKGAHFIEATNFGDFNEFGTGGEFGNEGGFNHFGGFGLEGGKFGFEGGKFGGFEGGKFGGFGSFNSNFDDIPSSALTALKLGSSRPKGNLKLSGSGGSGKRSRYNRGSIAGIRRPTRFILSNN